MNKVKYWLYTLFVRFFPDWAVKKCYLSAGYDFGYVISMMAYTQERIPEKILDRFEFWERIYSSRGFKTIPVGQWIDIGGWRGKTDGIFQKLKEGEKPVLYAPNYRKKYHGIIFSVKIIKVTQN